MDWLLFGIFTVLMLSGVPLAVAMGLAGTAVVAASGLGMTSLPTNVYTGIAKYPLMTPSGVRHRRTDLRTRRRGGDHRPLRPAPWSASAGAVWPSCSHHGAYDPRRHFRFRRPADPAAVGAVMLPSMLKAGYPRQFYRGGHCGGGLDRHPDPALDRLCHLQPAGAAGIGAGAVRRRHDPGHPVRTDADSRRLVAIGTPWLRKPAGRTAPALLAKPEGRRMGTAHW